MNPAESVERCADVEPVEKRADEELSREELADALWALFSKKRTVCISRATRTIRAGVTRLLRAASDLEKEGLIRPAGPGPSGRKLKHTYEKVEE